MSPDLLGGSLFDFHQRMGMEQRHAAGGRCLGQHRKLGKSRPGAWLAAVTDSATTEGIAR